MQTMRTECEIAVKRQNERNYDKQDSRSDPKDKGN